MATPISGPDDRLWRDLEGHRFASLFSSASWVELITRSYGLDVSTSARIHRGRIKSAILFSRVRDLRGERILCLPFSDYGDPLVEDPRDWDELIQPLLAHGAPVRLRCLHNDVPDQDRRFTRTNHAKYHAVDLSRPEPELWASLRGSARQNIRRAEHSGVVVREGRTLEDVRIFHRLHCTLRKSKYRLLAQPRAFFDNLFEIFAPSGQLSVLIAERSGRVIAGILVLQWRDVLYYKFNASIDSTWRPNDLLVWQAILLGHRRGLRRLDLGISDVGQPGLIRFKSKFATQEKDVRFLEWRPAGWRDPRGEEASRILARITTLVTEPSVPDEITRAAGDELYRFFC